jgi:hypothetical protein
MGSRLAALCSATQGVSAEAGFFLTALLHRYRDGNVGGLDQAWCKTLGMSARVLVRVREELIGQGYLEGTRQLAPARKGRPATIYKISPAIQAVWSGSGVGVAGKVGGHFESVIELLLAESESRLEGNAGGKGEPPSRKGAAQRLSASNRFVLMLLLGVADRNGVVRGWGPAELSGMAGLTKGAMAGQVDKLLKLGYLRAVVPGVSGQSLYGKKPGVFFLNLAHPAYRGRVAESVLLIPIERVGYPSGGGRDAEVLYGLLRGVSQGRPVSSSFNENSRFGELLRGAGFADASSIKALATHFDGIGTSTLPTYFQAKIEEYAAGLLPYGWGKYGGEGIRAPLRATVTKDSFAKPHVEPASTEGRAVKLVLHLALGLAMHVRRTLEETPELVGWYEEVSLGDFSYAIIPALTSSEKKHLVVSVVPVGGVMGLPRYVLSGDQVVSRVFTESDFSDEMAYKFGVLTRPLAKSNKNTGTSSAKNYRYRLQAKAFSAD